MMDGKRINARLKQVEARLDALTLPCTPSFLTRLMERVQALEDRLDGLEAEIDRR